MTERKGALQIYNTLSSKKEKFFINKSVFNKAHVDIRFNYKEGIGVRFDSSEEAEKYVNELVNASTKKFHVIINK